MSPDQATTMDIETAKAIFTRMYQSHDMLSLIDQNKNNSQLSVADLYKKFLDKYPENPDEHFFFNQHFVMGSFLALIVLPQSIVDNIDATILVANLDKSWHLTKLAALVYKVRRSKELTPKGSSRWVDGDIKQLPLKDFLRNIRNSISHARFSATSNANLTLTLEDRDEDKKKGTSFTHFRITLPLNDLYGFCKRFNEFIITGR
jgi:hypothetical protein